MAHIPVDKIVSHHNPVITFCRWRWSAFFKFKSPPLWFAHVCLQEGRNIHNKHIRVRAVCLWHRIETVTQGVSNRAKTVRHPARQSRSQAFCRLRWFCMSIAPQMDDTYSLTGNEPCWYRQEVEWNHFVVDKQLGINELLLRNRNDFIWANHHFPVWRY